MEEREKAKLVCALIATELLEHLQPSERVHPRVHPDITEVSHLGSYRLVVTVSIPHNIITVQQCMIHKANTLGNSDD